MMANGPRYVWPLTDDDEVAGLAAVPGFVIFPDIEGLPYKLQFTF